MLEGRASLVKQQLLSGASYSEGSTGSTVLESQLVWLLVQYLHPFLLAGKYLCCTERTDTLYIYCQCLPTVYCCILAHPRILYSNVSRMCQNKIHICTRIHIITEKLLLCVPPLLLCMWCVGTALHGCNRGVLKVQISWTLTHATLIFVGAASPCWPLFEQKD